MPRKRISEGLCSVDGCWNQALKKTWCSKHYQQFYKNSPDYQPVTYRRKHPFYSLWFERKSFGELCDQWLIFEKFVKDISPKPEGNYFLVKLRNEPFGPDNFQWQEHLKRKEGESKKDWYARKWKARQLANPSSESDRNIKRKFGLSREQYNEILKSQNNGCAICGKIETSVNAKTGTIKKLSVDHCHNSLKIRGLLCWRCNGTIGKVEDNVELMQKMINYINKHKGEI